MSCEDRFEIADDMRCCCRREFCDFDKFRVVVDYKEIISIRISLSLLFATVDQVEV